jgi:cell division septum initiation protein DivIVA
MGKNEKLFSMVFRGYDPGEVLAYIEVLDNVMKKTNKENQDKIDDLSSETEKLKKMLAEKEEELLSVEYKEKEIEELKEELARITEDNENQREAIVSQEEKISELKKENEALKAVCEQEKIKSEALEENSKEYASIVADVNNILSEARRKASELVSEATDKSAEIISDAKSRAKEEADAILEKSDEMLNENIKKVKYLYKRRDELAEIFKEHKAKVDNFFSSVNESMDKDKKS